MGTPTQEDGNKDIYTEKERKSLHLKSERLHTILMEREKEQPSTMIKTERSMTDFTLMIG